MNCGQEGFIITVLLSSSLLLFTFYTLHHYFFNLICKSDCTLFFLSAKPPIYVAHPLQPHPCGSVFFWISARFLCIFNNGKDK